MLVSAGVEAKFVGLGCGLCLKSLVAISKC